MLHSKICFASLNSILEGKFSSSESLPLIINTLDTVSYNKSGKTSSIFQTWRSAPREVAELAPRSRAVSRYRINIQWLCSEPVELEKPLSKSNSCLPNTKLKVARICLLNRANFILLRESIRYENTVLKTLRIMMYFHIQWMRKRLV